MKKVVSLPARRETYDTMLSGMVELLNKARQATKKTVNVFMTATYWEVGHRLVEFEQHGKARAEYGDKLLNRLGADLTVKFGRGFSRRNLQTMRQFYLCYPPAKIWQTLSAKSGKSHFSSASSSVEPIRQTVSAKSGHILQSLGLDAIALCFPLPWSHYARLISARSPEARAFYEEEAFRGGWSERTLDRQMSTLFYERMALSKDKAKMFSKHSKAHAGEAALPIETMREPLILEFLDLKDDYSESDFEEALVTHLQKFLLELGDDWAFVDRQRRLRLDSQWYRVDLLFYHRVLRCLVVIDLKLGKFTHADAGQMHLYLNYAREHWTRAGENPPVGLILCSTAEADVVRYALDGLPNRIMAAEARLKLPDEKRLLQELRESRREWEVRRGLRVPGNKRRTGK
ncbi:MAG: PDDEXK nuclease domain-containing protein [Fibrobacterota bacterium]